MPSIKRTPKTEASQTQGQQPKTVQTPDQQLKQAVGAQTRIDINQIVFASRPRQLRSWLASREMTADANLQADEVPAEEELLEMDGDQEMGDEEEDLEETEVAGELGGDAIPIDNYVAPPDGQLQWPASPVLDLNDHYRIVIGDSNSGGKFCHFQAPAWLTTHRIDSARGHTSKLGRFLKALAQWLQETRQEFLEKPSPQAFVAPETNFDTPPVVLQQGLLQEVNKFMARQKDHRKAFELDKAAFSRLLGSIRLCWPLWNMPLAAVFEPAYRRAWVLRGCLKSPRSWVGTPKDYGQKVFKDEKIQEWNTLPLDSLGPEERLTILLRRADGKKDWMAEIVSECQKLQKGT